MTNRILGGYKKSESSLRGCLLSVAFDSLYFSLNFFSFVFDSLSFLARIVIPPMSFLLFLKRKLLKIKVLHQTHTIKDQLINPTPMGFFEICYTFHRCQDFEPFRRVIILVSSNHICHLSRRLSASE